MTKGNILITGASTGIGFACTKKFVDEGYIVYGSVRKQEDADRLTDELGDNFQAIIFDVTDGTAIIKAANQLSVVLKSEGLQLLINNAGIAVTGPVELLDVDAYRHQFEVNYFGLIAVTKAFLPLLGGTINSTFESGKIINISSVASQRTLPFMSAYASSKAAVDSFTEGLRRELLVYGIDAVTINPGPIKSEIWEKIDPNIESVKGTVYENVLNRFMKLVDKETQNPLEASVLAQSIYRTFLKKKSKTSEVISKNKFFKYTLTNFMPARLIDGVIKKKLKI